MLPHREDRRRDQRHPVYDAASIQGHAEEIIFVDKVTGLINELLRNPSESFVRFLLAEVELVSGRVTKSVVERFVLIVKKAIQTTLLDMMTKSIQQEISQPNNSANSGSPEQRVRALWLQRAHRPLANRLSQTTRH